MKLFTYNNLTTGRQKETMHAESKEEMLDQMSKLGFKIEIIDEFDPDSFLEGVQKIPVNNLPPDPMNIKQPPKEEKKTIFFETNGVKFKVVNDVVYKRDWIEITNKKDYKVIRALKGKNDSIRETNITNDVKLYRNDWVEVDKKDEE